MNETNYKELYEAQCEETRKLKKDNRELCDIIRKNENHSARQKDSIQTRLSICFFIGGIVAYLMFTCFPNFEDWSFGMSLGEVIGQILLEIFKGGAYSFSNFVLGSVLFICVKDSPSKKQ
ncbi:MAG: hypothetical protein IJE01_01510 [Clostridia bacterium]|nr:hypothetical protein [Clostridia bacterium]